MQIHLDQSVKARLQANKGNWKDYATKSGVSYSWVCKFAQDLIPRPGFAMLQKLDAVLPALEEQAAEPNQAAA